MFFNEIINAKDANEFIEKFIQKWCKVKNTIDLKSYAPSRSEAENMSNEDLIHKAIKANLDTQLDDTIWGDRCNLMEFLYDYTDIEVNINRKGNISELIYDAILTVVTEYVYRRCYKDYPKINEKVL